MADYFLKRSELVEICEGKEDIASGLQTKDELEAFFSEKSTPGLWLKDIMTEVGIPQNQIPATKSARLTWVLDNVEIEGIIDASSHDDSNNGDSQDDGGGDNHDSPADTVVPCTLTLADIQRFFRDVPDSCFQPSKDMDVTPLTIYENIPVEYQDQFLTRYLPDIYEGLAVILKGNEKTVTAIGTLQRTGDEYHILLERKNIDYPAFQNNKRYRLALFPAGASEIFGKEQLETSDSLEFNHPIHTGFCTINYKPMEETGNTLCIDFGTSNTSAGSYGLLDRKENKIELVSFVDVTSAEMRASNLYPTLVYVNNCSDPKNIRYLFGYEAKQLLTDKNYDTDASVFFEIKRWIGTLEQEEEIQDEEGNTVSVRRGDIVRAYILHIIDLAQQHFKVRFRKLHLSAPVKLKAQFYKEMNEMLKDRYTVLRPESSVDEGVAIIYDSISRLVAKNIIREDEPASIMILDCGGGTTDLASCEVSAKSLKSATKLEITTKFVNGNSNFGGNNITFRIMQLLKIKLAEKFAPELMQNCSLKELIPMEESQILCAVEDSSDDGGHHSYNSDTPTSRIYQAFQAAYAKAEEVIPTVFTDNSRFRYLSDRKKIRRNYYYLWQLAEKVKIKFYKDDVVSVDFRHSGNTPLDFDRLSAYYLYVVKDGKLERVDDPAGAVEITINEIRKVLCGDIYGLLNELLDQDEIEIDDYKFYRLAGQSCTINLFMELLKEFIPGRKLRSSPPVQETEGEPVSAKGSVQLKLDCIQGCIAYIRDKECSKIHPEIETDRPKLIYDIYVRKSDEETMLVSHEEPDEIEYAAVSGKAAKVELLVKNVFGEVERKVDVNFKGEAGTGSLDELFDRLRQKSIVSPEGLRRLQDKIIAEDPRESDEADFVRLVFAVPAKGGYGMYICRLAKESQADGTDRYTWCRDDLYENYENESTKSFFDGRR